MPKTIHFLSGLPRSCSTLLANLLAQNQRVHVSPTSCLYDFVEHSRKAIESPAAKALPAEELQRLAEQFARAGILGAYDNATERPVAVDKSRAWVMSPDMLFRLFPNAKLIVPVRDIRGIVTSLEKKRRENPIRFAPAEDASWVSLEGRVQGWLNQGPVPGALQGVLETSRRFKDRVLFVHAEALTTNPEAEMARIWKYLGEEPVAHDFSNVAQYTTEIDVGWPYGDHVIRSEVKPLRPEWHDVLGAQISSVLDQKFGWINTL